LPSSEENNNLEIYQQRYETWRHLDALRWHLMQVGVSAAVALFTFASVIASPWFWASVCGVGFVLILTAIAMHRVGDAIMGNGKVLREFGAKIGDKNIPLSKNRGVAFYIAIAMGLTGAVSVITSVCNFFHTIN
jgi:hypothetical protein